MRIDVDATKSREIFYQAELYRILKNGILEIARNPQSFFKTDRGIAIRYALHPWDVLIEASVTGDESAKLKDRADIVLLGRKEEETKVLLVIELKKPVAGTPTRGFQGALKQAYGYAQQLDCKYYAAYDGDTLVIMQRQYPFLVGLAQRYIRSHEQILEKFAEELWSLVVSLDKESPDIPTGVFKRHIQYYPRWKRTIRSLIKDAYKRHFEEQGLDIEMEKIEEKSEEISKKWDELNN